MQREASRLMGRRSFQPRAEGSSPSLRCCLDGPGCSGLARFFERYPLSYSTRKLHQGRLGQPTQQLTPAQPASREQKMRTTGKVDQDDARRGDAHPYLPTPSTVSTAFMTSA